MTLRSFTFLFALVLSLFPVLSMAETGITGTDYAMFADASPIGLALIAAGMLLVIAEIMIISHGLLALSGTLFFIIGSVFIIQSANPAMRLLWINFLASGLFIVAGITVLSLWALTIYRNSKSHRFSLAGQKALIVTWDDKSRRVEIDGSFWNAQSLSGKEYSHGEWVTIHSQDNLTLYIE